MVRLCKKVVGSHDIDRPPKRQARGEQKRARIVAAALRVVERDGLDGVTHRSVAAEAEVPLASTTYYFASKEDLMQAAMELLVAREAESLRDLAQAVMDGDVTVAEGIEGLIAWQASLMREERRAQIAQFELFLRVARTEGGPVAWTEPYRVVARSLFERLGTADPDADARGVVALVNGLSLVQLTDPVEDYESRVLGPTVRRHFAAALSPPPAPPA